MRGNLNAALLLLRKMKPELRERSGCCLHIVLDDGNLEDTHVEFCVGYAEEQGHRECVHLASLMLDLEEVDRQVVEDMYLSF